MQRLTILLFVFSAVVGFALCAEGDEPAPAAVPPESNVDQISSFDGGDYAPQEGANVDLDRSATQYRAERSAYYGGGYYGGGYGGYGGYNRYYGGGGYPYYGGGYNRGYYGGGYPGHYGHHGGYYGHHHRYY